MQKQQFIGIAIFFYRGGEIARLSERSDKAQVQGDLKSSRQKTYVVYRDDDGEVQRTADVVDVDRIALLGGYYRRIPYQLSGNVDSTRADEVAAFILACLIAAFITPRLPPLSRKADNYVGGKPKSTSVDEPRSASLLNEAWNNAMQDYLGITPANDAQGVLQDIHWSSGLFGYFPTYALGNLVGAQLWEKLITDSPDILDQIQQGEFESLTAWMKDKIHRHGAKFEPQELVQRITGSKIDPDAYMRYLTNKYTDVYEL